ncbi:MAG TPA: AmmeMemoRadiSam system protein B [Polyangia bacterium]|nr:AmmeMemoRadiSam system protein B [Polyangia bacterium]
MLLPRLRSDLDFMASPFPERPGLLIRDPHRYSDATLIVPPALVSCLGCFDGTKSEVDLRDVLLLSTGLDTVTEIATDLVRTLREAGMLDDQLYARLKSDRHRQFEQAPLRTAVHSGAGYPEEPGALGRMLTDFVAAGGKPARETLIGVAAPHVSPGGGIACYGAAYGVLPRGLEERTFVILGTSHYGEPNRFGLTRKPFRTPLGDAETDAALVATLAERAGDGAKIEDYCHAVEHSIEFQVLFLQHLYGPRVRILPILCGPLGTGERDARPERSAAVSRFLGALGELAAREAHRMFWVLGIDMAHVGRRYGDRFPAEAHQGPLTVVAERDRRRIDRIGSGDADGFWDLVHENQHDDLKWCGSSPLYTFLRAVPQARGRLLRYDQWNIDAESVVSFAALAFR